MTKPVSPAAADEDPQPRVGTMRGAVSTIIHDFGPGLVTGAADDDPSGIATYAQGGAQFGTSLLWTLVLTYPLMSVVQLISAQIGRVTGHGLATNMKRIFPAEIAMGLVGLLFIANVINIGADLAAMGSSAALVIGLPAHSLTIGFAAVSLLLQVLVPYHSYARFLKWLTLALFSYIALLFTVRLDWGSIATGLLLPRVSSRTALVTIVAIFGTTISPYLFFWQSAQEVEEIDDHPGEKPLGEQREAAAGEFARMRIDTWSGMALSNIVAIAIMIGTAATLHAAGKTSIETAADAAQALKPIAGRFSSLLFSLGVIGTGLLAVPVLAGSTAYAVAELRGWRSSLGSRFHDAEGFYAIIIVATSFGVAIDWSPLDPIRALFWSAVINGVVAVPLLGAIMILAVNPRVMGGFPIGPAMRITGWATTIVMTLAVGAMFLL
jgi:NRAMP (natural resistance-associated macrophage protein)-like metal ion transporter